MPRFDFLSFVFSKGFHIPFHFFYINNNTNVHSVWSFLMLYHLTDIFVNTSFKYHFCPIVIPLKITFTYSTSIISIQCLNGNKSLKSKQNMPFRYYTEFVTKKRAKCDWMKLSNTNKTFQIY